MNNYLTYSEDELKVELINCSVKLAEAVIERLELLERLEHYSDSLLNIQTALAVVQTKQKRGSRK